MKRVLFLCTANRLRSPTAEQVFSAWPDVDVDSAGLAADAIVPVSTEQIEWADIIFVMEKVHRARLTKRFRRHLYGKRVISLDIPDEYDFMDPALRTLLVTRAGPHLR